MTHIHKIKTMYGTKYAVVELFSYQKPKVDAKGNVIKKGNKVEYVTNKEYHAVEYGKGQNIKVAIFDLTPEGLEKAREVQALFNAKAKVGAK